MDFSLQRIKNILYLTKLSRSVIFKLPFKNKKVKQKLKKGAAMLKTKNIKTFGRKLYVVWFGGVTIVSAVILYQDALFTYEVFLAGSLVIFGLVELVDNIK